MNKLITVEPIRMARAEPIPEKGLVLYWLRHGKHPVCAPMWYKDRETGENAVEAVWWDDGVYTWSSDTVYHFAKNDYPLPEEFVEHVRKEIHGRRTTPEEADILYDAMWDLEKTGWTEIRCPRCGNELAVEVSGDSALVFCKTTGCLFATRRGL